MWDFDFTAEVLESGSALDDLPDIIPIRHTAVSGGVGLLQRRPMPICQLVVPSTYLLEHARNKQLQATPVGGKRGAKKGVGRGRQLAKHVVSSCAELNDDAVRRIREQQEVRSVRHRSREQDHEWPELATAGKSTNFTTINKAIIAGGNTSDTSINNSPKTSPTRKIVEKEGPFSFVTYSEALEEETISNATDAAVELTAHDSAMLNYSTERPKVKSFADIFSEDERGPIVNVTPACDEAPLKDETELGFEDGDEVFHCDDILEGVNAIDVGDGLTPEDGSTGGVIFTSSLRDVKFLSSLEELNCYLLIEHIPLEAVEKELQELLESFGAVISFTVEADTDAQTKRALVRMEKPSQCDWVVSCLQGMQYSTDEDAALLEVFLVDDLVYE